MCVHAYAYLLCMYIAAHVCVGMHTSRSVFCAAATAAALSDCSLGTAAVIAAACAAAAATSATGGAGTTAATLVCNLS